MKKGTKQQLQRALHETGLSGVDLNQVVGGIIEVCSGDCSTSCTRGCSAGCSQACQTGKAKGVIGDEISPIDIGPSMAV